MESVFAHLAAETACAAVRGAGFACSPEELAIERRDETWTVTLPGGRMAWFPASGAGTRRLAIERHVLRLLAERCSFQAPRLLAVSDSGFDVRRMVRGRSDPWGLFRRCRMDSALARRIGRSVGAILAEQHTSFREVDAVGWLPGRPSWPETGDWIRARLSDVADDGALVRRMSLAVERYEAMAVEPHDRVLVHGDVGLHNLALDPTGTVIDRARVKLCNLACAISYLAYRQGTPADETSCGRTLDEDLRWVRSGLEAVGM